MQRSSRIAAAIATIFSIASTNVLPQAANSERCVTSDLLSEMMLYSQYSAATYCDHNSNGTVGTPITCASGNSCPGVESSQASIYGNFFNISNDSTTGLVAIDPLHSTIVLAFRGAEYDGSFIQDSQLVHCPAICAACNCHEGFYSSWIVVRDMIVGLIKAAQLDYPDYKIVVTGHSLGAIQANFAAAE
jgi:hypothetical protein